METDSFHWDDLNTAYRVAQQGSLSRAGRVMGLNHSTVLRRIERLEAEVGVRLFIRHQSGYRLTDAGQMLLERMEGISGEVNRLFRALSTQDKSPSGTLKISTVSDFSLFFAPFLLRFRDAYPEIRLQVVATDDVLSLVSGDVHVSLRIGQQPPEPDLIAHRLVPIRHDYCVAPAYAERHGVPTSMEEVNRHLWVLPTGEKRKISGIWQLVEKIDPNQVVFESNSFTDIHSAVREGMGIGPVGAIQRYGSKDFELISAEFGLELKPTYMWFVYHKDMRGSARINALKDFFQANLTNAT